MRAHAKQENETIGWCGKCNVPVLGRACEICGSAPFEVRLSPPGDVRFASPKGRKLISDSFARAFGVSDIINGKLVLLNKIPGLDRTDEIIIDGTIIGVLIFDLEKLEYKLDLREGGLAYLSSANKRVVEIDRQAMLGRHVKGRGIRKCEVVSYGEGIERDDDVILKFGEFFGLGRARFSTKEYEGVAREANVLRVRELSKAHSRNMRRATMHEAVRANLSYLKALEERAVRELKCAFSSSRKQPTVSFSGGKDSLVACELAKLAIGEARKKTLHLIYIDTGLEFPETKKFVEDYAKREGMVLKIAQAENAFEENLAQFGPPSKDMRWCCKVCKLAPVSSLIAKEYPEGCISADGKRKRESFARAFVGAHENNPFVPDQTSYYPIRDWRALDVWLYIRYRGLEYNPLYDEDYERIGCYMCPAELGSEFENMKETHPGLHDKWLRTLYSFAKDSGVSEDYVKHGFWRWRAHPPKMVELAGRLGVSLSVGLDCHSQRGNDAKDAKNEWRITRGCAGRHCTTSSDWSIEGRFVPSRRTTLVEGTQLLKTLGELRISDELGVALLNIGDRARAKVFAGGAISVTSSNKDECERAFDEVSRALLRADMCSGCGICARACMRGAVRVLNGARVVIDEKRCDRCGKCDDGCVVAKYSSRLMK